MIFQKTRLKGLFIITPELKLDKRGYFARIYCNKEFKKNRLNFEIVQIGKSMTKYKGTIRGLHFQKEPFWEEKIVVCTKGSIFDVAADLRPDSETFGEWVSEKLSGENKKMVYLPKGFAHGFQTLTDDCEVEYFLSEHYSPEHAWGVKYNDPSLNIKWPVKKTILSDNDKDLPFLTNV